MTHEYKSDITYSDLLQLFNYIVETTTLLGGKDRYNYLRYVYNVLYGPLHYNVLARTPRYKKTDTLKKLVKDKLEKMTADELKQIITISSNNKHVFDSRKNAITILEILFRGMPTIQDELNPNFQGNPAAERTAERKSHPGELHARFNTPDGGTIRANYAGPFTNLLTRLRRADPPVNETDRISRLHDIRYSLALSTQDIRNADIEMIELLDIAEEKKLDLNENIELARSTIKAKVLAEDEGIADPSMFVNLEENKNMSQEDHEFLKSELRLILAREEIKRERKNNEGKINPPNPHQDMEDLKDIADHVIDIPEDNKAPAPAPDNIDIESQQSLNNERDEKYTAMMRRRVEEAVKLMGHISNPIVISGLMHILSNHNSKWDPLKLASITHLGYEAIMHIIQAVMNEDPPKPPPDADTPDVDAPDADEPQADPVNEQDIIEHRTALIENEQPIHTHIDIQIIEDMIKHCIISPSDIDESTEKSTEKSTDKFEELFRQEVELYEIVPESFDEMLIDDYNFNHFEDAKFKLPIDSPKILETINDYGSIPLRDIAIEQPNMYQQYLDINPSVTEDGYFANQYQYQFLNRSSIYRDEIQFVNDVHFNAVPTF
jgi:hypothetical protein